MKWSSLSHGSVKHPAHGPVAGHAGFPVRQVPGVNSEEEAVEATEDSTCRAPGTNSSHVLCIRTGPVTKVHVNNCAHSAWLKYISLKREGIRTIVTSCYESSLQYLCLPPQKGTFGILVFIRTHCKCPFPYNWNCFICGYSLAFTILIDFINQCLLI